MKLHYLSILISSFLFYASSNAQSPFNYDKAWKRVMVSLEERNLPKTALNQIDTILSHARKDKNDPQLIKGILFKIQLNEQLTEEPFIKRIEILETEILAAKEPTKSIFLSLLADFYLNQFQQIRWKLYDRTTTVNFEKSDVETWSATDFHKKITELYLQSIAEVKLLQSTPVDNYDTVILKGNSRHLRPTLYDLLVNRAIDYFSNEERLISKPSYAFSLEGDEVFAPADQFIRWNPDPADSLSLHLHVVKLYQQLLQFHLNDANPAALIDADLNRLKFMQRYSIHEDRNELYKQSIYNLANKYGNIPEASGAWYTLAAWYAEQAQSYDPLTDTSNRFLYLKALEICRMVISNKTTSEGKQNCHNLMATILQKQLQVFTEKVNEPGKPFRMMVEYKNISSLYTRIIPLNRSQKELFVRRSWETESWDMLSKLKFIKERSYNLPDTRDHQNHRVEIDIDELNPGTYAILTSLNKDLTAGTDNPMAVSFIHVSAIAYINYENDYYILNRETGEPIQNALVQVWNRSYDRELRRDRFIRKEKYSAGKDGRFTLIQNDSKNRYEQRYFEISAGRDTLFLDDVAHNYSFPAAKSQDGYTPEQYERNYNRVFLFTDRSVYRPGQTVFFKGIAVTRDYASGKYRTLEGYRSVQVLEDVNGQEIDSLILTTDAFGTFNGKFTIPSHLLNGRFTIRDMKISGRASISVEEYKRPKYYVELKPERSDYLVNDTVTVHGVVTGYAGNLLNNTNVNYRVIRKPRYRYPIFSYNRMRMPYPTEEMEIAHGELISDSKGEFKIVFPAIGDKKIPEQASPLFNYEVIVETSDISGEPGTANTYVVAGYQSVQISIQGPEFITTQSLKDIKITATDLSGKPQHLIVRSTIHKLNEPERVFRDRLWAAPDQFIMNKETYYKLFPHDIYADENNPKNMDLQNLLFNKSDSLTFNNQPDFSKLDLKEGWYRMEASAIDKTGDTVSAVHYFQIVGPDSKGPAFGALTYEQDTLNPGNEAKFRYTTNLGKIRVYQSLLTGDSAILSNSLAFRDRSDRITVRDDISSVSGVYVSYAFIRNNRIYSGAKDFLIKRPGKDLNITYKTYRNKTLPGSRETWTINISGEGRDKIAASVLTAMYDASLDQILPHSWQIPNLWQSGRVKPGWSAAANFKLADSYIHHSSPEYYPTEGSSYDELLSVRYSSSVRMQSRRDISAAPVAEGAIENKMADQRQKLQEVNFGEADSSGVPVEDEVSESPVQIRKNFNETAFFLPDLSTDEQGNITFSFEIPEAVTTWKWMTLAHTKDLSFGYNEQSVITQKELMIQPSAPRFLREGDRIDLSGKISNLTDKEFTGQVELRLMDAETNTPIDGWFQNVIPNQYFTAAAGESVPVSFSIAIPVQYTKPIIYRMVAKTEDHSDGEEGFIPIVTNRILVTETLPINISGEKTSGQYKFEKLINSGESNSLSHHALTVEVSANPAWYAVQALPYLKEKDCECAEQIFNRYYANALAAKIAGETPRLKAVLEQWKITDSTAFLSNLEKNQELKSVLLQETPWVMEAKSEAEQKRNILLLFDLIRMSSELNDAVKSLVDMQSPNGGFVWMKGGREDRYITQYIITGIGHLRKLNAIHKDTEEELMEIAKRGIEYLDEQIAEDYSLVKSRKKPVSGQDISEIQIQYLYSRSFFTDINVPGTTFQGYNYYRNQSKKHWTKFSRYMQGMTALSLFKTGEVNIAGSIVKSLKENSITDTEKGMYWKDMRSGYFWYQAPVESQALLIEAFADISKDQQSVNDMKRWLLSHKQTNRWRSSRATADAVYALLLQGGSWLNETPSVKIELGNISFSSDNEPTASTIGYMKKSIEGTKVKPEMGNIGITVKHTARKEDQAPVWGAVYYQYFEQADKVTKSDDAGMKLSKKIFIEKNTDRGPVLEPVNNNDYLKIGDRLTVRIEIRSDRDMEYVHMKDMRSSSMEPANTISGYRWQGGLGYYQSTGDVSTNFYFSRLNKGIYVFEYPLTVTHSGTFSNGITSIQCLYAPEFSSHSEGVIVNIEGK